MQTMTYYRTCLALSRHAALPGLRRRLRAIVHPAYSRTPGSVASGQATLARPTIHCQIAPQPPASKLPSLLAA
jgi:hypothetical protein